MYLVGVDSLFGQIQHLVKNFGVRGRLILQKPFGQPQAFSCCASFHYLLLFLCRITFVRMADGQERVSETPNPSEGGAIPGAISEPAHIPKMIAFCTSCEQYANSNDKYASTPLQLHWPKKSKNKAPPFMLLGVQFGMFVGVLSLGILGFAQGVWGRALL